MRYIDIFDKYRYFKNIDKRYSILRISKISKVSTSVNTQVDFLKIISAITVVKQRTAYVNRGDEILLRLKTRSARPAKQKTNASHRRDVAYSQTKVSAW